MEIIKHDSFRSSGTLVNQSDDMERVVIDMTKREFQEFRAKLSHNMLDRQSRHKPCGLTPIDCERRKR